MHKISCCAEIYSYFVPDVLGIFLDDSFKKIYAFSTFINVYDVNSCGGLLI